MLPFKKILFPVDFSEQARGAARYVEVFAGRFESGLTLLHVFDLPKYNELQPESRTQRQQRLDSFLARELEYFRVERALVEGDPASKILEMARTGRFDLIMLPTHGLGGFRRFLLGSVAAKVLHDAECPVWTGVHLDQAPPLDKIVFRNLLCAVDLGPHSRQVLTSAAELAEEYRARLCVVTATPAPEIYVDADFALAVAKKAAEGLEELVRSTGVKAEIVVEGGEVDKAVSSVAARLQADLLVIGRSPATGILGRLRTHAYSIIRQSPCPVLSV
jgi:nucleotide-binding universal stress UspA family protein